VADVKPAKLDTATGELANFASGNTVPVGNGGTGLSTVASKALLYASALDTLAALAVGSNGDVLTVSAGSPAWAAPSAATPSARACCIYLSSDQTGISASTWTRVAYNAAATDPDSIADITTNKGRVTVPASYGGEWEISICAGGNDNGDYKIYKNGSAIGAPFIWTSPGNVSYAVVTFVLTLAAGDYIEVFVNTSSGANRRATLSGDAATYYRYIFSARFLGA
jgi:hypothetical protein